MYSTGIGYKLYVNYNFEKYTVWQRTDLAALTVVNTVRYVK